LRIKRRGVSTIIAELLLIVITVAIGTLVYSFASTAFGGFGAGFSNLVQEAGNQLAENVVVEQVYFINVINGTLPETGNACPITFTCGDLYLRNVGANTVTVNNIYVTNITLNAPISPTSAPPCPNIPVSSSPATQVCFHTWDKPADKYDIPLPVQLTPGNSVMVRFFIPVAVHPGTVYAFTLVTGRGNQFVAYEKR